MGLEAQIEQDLAASMRAKDEPASARCACFGPP